MQAENILHELTRKGMEKDEAADSNRDSSEQHDSEHDDRGTSKCKFSFHINSRHHNQNICVMLFLVTIVVSTPLFFSTERRTGRVGKTLSQDESGSEEVSAAHHSSAPSSGPHSHQSLRSVNTLRLGAIRICDSASLFKFEEIVNCICICNMYVILNNFPVRRLQSTHLRQTLDLPSVTLLISLKPRLTTCLETGIKARICYFQFTLLMEVF